MKTKTVKVEKNQNFERAEIFCPKCLRDKLLVFCCFPLISKEGKGNCLKYWVGLKFNDMFWLQKVTTSIYQNILLFSTFQDFLGHDDVVANVKVKNLNVFIQQFIWENRKSQVWKTMWKSKHIIAFLSAH